MSTQANPHLKGVDPRYFERHKFPKWNIRPTVTDEHRLFPRVFPELTKSEHERLARLYLGQVRVLGDAYEKAGEDALIRYGDQGSLISGALRDHFPEKVKDKLRNLAHAETFYRRAAEAHWKASGKRSSIPPLPSPTYTSRLSALVWAGGRSRGGENRFPNQKVQRLMDEEARQKGGGGARPTKRRAGRGGGGGGAKYEVIVGNIGTVYAGGDNLKAHKEFLSYVKDSKAHYGRASGEGVVLFCNGEIEREHFGSNQNEE